MVDVGCGDLFEVIYVILVGVVVVCYGLYIVNVVVGEWDLG